MKLKFFYTNGKSWNASSVKDFDEDDNYIYYSRYNRKTGITEAYDIPKEDVAALAVKHPFHMEVIKYKAISFKRLSLV